MREFYPFYVTYGSPLFLQGDTIEEQEFDRLKGDYPQMARQVQALVERECDLLDYEGSWLYDEHPDKWAVYRLSRKIRRQIEGQQLTGQREIPQMEKQWISDRKETPQIESRRISGRKENPKIEGQQLSGQKGNPPTEKQQSPESGKELQTTEQGRPELTAAGGDFLEELIEVLLFHEISRRRCRRRRYFYPGGRF